MLLILAAAAAALAVPPDQPADDPAAALAALRQVYQQSCAARAYAAYDDVCDQLDQQVRRAEAEAARHPRKPLVPAGRVTAAPPPAKDPPPPSAPVTTPTPAPDLAGKPPS